MSWASRGLTKAKRLFGLVRQGEIRTAAVSAGANIWATSRAYGLRRDLSVPFTAPEAKVPLTVRPLEERDVPHLMKPGAGDSAFQLDRQRRLLEAEIQTCWVAVDEDDLPCYMQWLIIPDHNHLVQETFGPEFPPLSSDEVLLEGAFTPARARGQRIGPRAMSLITEQAPPQARWAWTYVAVDNLAALKLVTRSGYHPASLRRSTWRFLRQNARFEELTGEVPTFD